ncbi:RDD family protein [Sutcliffiella cohnii]|uniref:RDD domain-containing protein n=1 Tax=Sutcliffiella cohnii TaxID=33932 RepID=A0A223KPU9_9BACI|nr:MULTISPECIES: RDD family protein [Sutcliffiella]AST91530.1 hypothetical protein BC6307_09670 [Sutcliffiella cohnii]WBL17361.1 RDD family protein [Sutcliffiella sp. NC1]
MENKLEIKTPEFVSVQFSLAGLGSRAAAFLIDQAIITITYLLLFLLFYFIDESISIFADGSSILFAVIIISIFVIQWGYFFVLEFFYGGRTIGKKLIGIRVIQENGHSLTLLSSIIRNLLRIIDALPTSYFIGMIMVFFHSKHKRVGDIVAGTIVVHERSKKKKDKKSSMEEELNLRGLYIGSQLLDKDVVSSYNQKDWELVKVYYNRFLQLPYNERVDITEKLAIILLPKAGVNLSTLSQNEKENYLLFLYILLKEEWEYEL